MHGLYVENTLYIITCVEMLNLHLFRRHQFCFLHKKHFKMLLHKVESLSIKSAYCGLTIHYICICLCGLMPVRKPV